VRCTLACLLIAAAVLSESCGPELTVYNLKMPLHPLPDTAACVLLGMDDTARIAGRYLGYITYEDLYELGSPFPPEITGDLKTAARRKGANLVEVTDIGPRHHKMGYTIYAAIYKVANAQQYEPSIEWTGNRKLDFPDFKGPASLGGDTVRSLGSYEFYLIHEIGSPQNKRAYNTRVEFYGNASWIDKGAPDSGELLLHEQGNFDLCEIYRLQLQRWLYGPHNEDISPEDIYRQVHAAYLAKRAQYESETAHGLNYTAQAAWTRRITALSGFDAGPLLRRQLKSPLPVVPDPLWGPGPGFPVPFLR
jgi:hypothetical protein